MAIAASQFVIWVLLDAPLGYDSCAGEPPPGHPADLREFRIPAFALTLCAWTFGVYQLLRWTAEIRGRRGKPAMPAVGAVVTAAICLVLAVVLGIETFDVTGEDTDDGFWIVVVAIYLVVPGAFVVVSGVGLLISLFAPESRWRSWLDRTGPLFLASVLIVGVPCLYALVLGQGGGSFLC